MTYTTFIVSQLHRILAEFAEMHTNIAQSILRINKNYKAVTDMLFILNSIRIYNLCIVPGGTVLSKKNSTIVQVYQYITCSLFISVKTESNERSSQRFFFRRHFLFSQIENFTKHGVHGDFLLPPRRHLTPVAVDA